MATMGAPSRQVPMQGLGDRLRARARELGLSDAEVARRSGLGQTRYAGYVIDRHEPDLMTLKRICSVLGVSATDLLGGASLVTNDAEALRTKISAALEALDQRSLEVAAIVVDGLVARLVPDRATDAGSPTEPEVDVPHETRRD